MCRHMHIPRKLLTEKFFKNVSRKQLFVNVSRKHTVSRQIVLILLIGIKLVQLILYMWEIIQMFLLFSNYYKWSMDMGAQLLYGGMWSWNYCVLGYGRNNKFSTDRRGFQSWKWICRYIFEWSKKDKLYSYWNARLYRYFLWLWIICCWCK